MNNISKEYFSATEYAVSRMIEFINGFESEDEYLDKAEEIFPGLICEGNTMFIYFFDLVKCYKKLGYDTDLSKRETLALFLSIYKGLSGEKNHSIDSLDSMIKAGEDVFNESVEIIRMQLPAILDDCEFLFIKILSEIPGYEDAEKHYCILLYRICSIIAKADGTITPRESRWLSRLLMFSESKKGERPYLKLPADRAKTGFAKNIKTGSLIKSSALQELDSLIGLEKVKKEVNTLANFAIVQKKRAEKGLKATPVSMHLVFSGNPGTGKTTVARIMGQIYKDLGLLKTGHLVETDRSALVAEYVGQTAAKTNKIIDSALGGVLFIDEAYSLVSNSKEDFGAEAISTLLKRMEDNRDNLAVILAGYNDKMEEFIASNPGLSSRFSRKIEFEDYCADDLFKIYQIQLDKYDYLITYEAAEEVKEIILDMIERKPSDFGNGRFARNLFERTIESQADRVAFIAEADEATLRTIEFSDVKNTATI